MVSTKPASASYLHLISGLLLVFSAYRFWQLHYAPKTPTSPESPAFLFSDRNPSTFPGSPGFPGAAGVVQPGTGVMPPGMSAGSQPPAFSNARSQPLRGGSGALSTANLDIQSLIGQSAEVIKRKLGPPSMTFSASLDRNGQESSSLIYRQADRHLAVRYDETTGRVRYLYLNVLGTPGLSSKELIEWAKLNPKVSVSNYYVELVPRRSSSPNQTGAPKVYRSLYIRTTSDPKLKGRVREMPTNWSFPSRALQSSFQNSQTLGQDATRFNVPQLFHRDIAGVKTILGTPLVAHMDADIPSLQALDYQRGNQRLRVRYDGKTGQVVDFYLPAANPDGYTSSTRIANGGQIIDSYSRDYRLIWDYKPGSNRIYTGLRVIPLSSSGQQPPSSVSSMNFDIPPLIGLDIQTIQSQLGIPANTSTTNSSNELLYFRGNDVLIIQYNPHTSKVSNFVLALRGGKHDLTRTEVQALTKRSGLQTSSNRYRVEWISRPQWANGSQTSTRFGSVRVTPM
jgi:hypothetical protein